MSEKTYSAAEAVDILKKTAQQYVQKLGAKVEDLAGLFKNYRQSDIQAIMKSFGWTLDRKEGDHEIFSNKFFKTSRPIPFQHGRKDMDRTWLITRHLNPAGLMLTRSNEVKPDPNHEFYQHYMRAAKEGKINQRDWSPKYDLPPEQTKNSWHVPGATQVPIESVDQGGDPYASGNELGRVLNRLRQDKADPNKKVIEGLPAIEVLDTQDGRFGTLSNHHLLEAGKQSGMTHVPVKIVS